MLPIPAIDILNGNVVRLQKGNFNKVTVYNNSVLEQAKIFNSFNLSWIHLVDLLGSKNGEINILSEIETIKKNTDLKIEFGGGIRSVDNAKSLVSAGVDNLILGSLSVSNKNEFERIVNYISPDKVIVAADVLNDKIAVRGWTEITEVSVFEHINYCKSVGVKKFLVTDIAQDGMLMGPSVELYKRIILRSNEIKLYASGGVSSIDDLFKLKQIGAYSAIIGKAIYEQKINLKELTEIAN